MKDPFPVLRGIKEDMAFMDDGAKSPRFAPYFSNSGFYFVKHNERTRYLMEKMLKSSVEISFTHSHQATLMRHMIESHHVVPQGLSVLVLDLKEFPSGPKSPKIYI
jgi:Nucleotide-diphospho-sugar transferase